MESDLIHNAERIEELTDGRIPFDRACWIALYIHKINNGVSHEQAIAEEEQEKQLIQSSPAMAEMLRGKILAALRQPQAMDIEGVCEDVEELLKKAGVL